MVEAHQVVEAWVDRRQMSMLLNSGCTQTLVQQARGQPLEAALLVHCIHGDIRPYHLRWAKLQVGGGTASL